MQTHSAKSFSCGIPCKAHASHPSLPQPIQNTESQLPNLFVPLISITDFGYTVVFIWRLRTSRTCQNISTSKILRSLQAYAYIVRQLGARFARLSVRTLSVRADTKRDTAPFTTDAEARRAGLAFIRELA